MILVLLAIATGIRENLYAIVLAMIIQNSFRKSGVTGSRRTPKFGEQECSLHVKDLLQSLAD
jgi:hypothetical protein